MHFASHTLVGESMQNPFLYLGDNVTNGLNLLAEPRCNTTCGASSSPPPPTSSTSRSVCPSPRPSASCRAAPTASRNSSWSASCTGWTASTACASPALRYFNACGASAERGEDHHPELHLIPIVLEVARGKREKVTIFGDDYPTPDGTCVRDYVHVLDLAQAHILALCALDRGSRTYNLGNGQGFSVKEVVETVRQVTGQPIPAEIGPRRPGDPAVLVASSDAIRRELGWEPQYTRPGRHRRKRLALAPGASAWV